MSTTPLYSTGQVQTAPNRWLWAAVGALGATVLALGVALVQMRSAPTPSSTPEVAVPALNAPAVATASSPAPIAAPVASTSNEPVAPLKHAPITTKKIASKSVAPAAPTAAQTQPVAVATPMPPPPPRVICAHCGTVTAVTPIQRDGAGSGAGAVAGAVLGGLLGNQVGGGTGKTIATVVGAVGGGYAGNTVEKRMKKETVYHIDLRMEDGNTMRLEHPSPLSVGAHVTVNNGVITP
ncbi:MAG: glycine zipper 2TM domain-containing protein [Rhodoferax sp.]|nr:glycine zipper 2TM domain-containing protein [Rhodoferax sp.]